MHATDDRVRQTLLGRAGPSILELLRRLTGAGIEIQAQIVLCPGINDGPVLERSIADLQALHPGVHSLAVVPVGLTGFRSRLPRLRSPNRAEARALVELIHACQARFLGNTGSRFVFAADELYLKADLSLPALDAYEDLAQLENGVGLLARFRAEAVEVLAEAGRLRAEAVTTVTGTSAFAEISRFVADLAAMTGVEIRLHAIANGFFGGEVSVAGLLTGADLLTALRGVDLGAALLLPDVMLRDGEGLLLDDLTPIDLERELGTRVRIIRSSPWGLLEALEDLAADTVAIPPGA